MAPFVAKLCQLMEFCEYGALLEEMLRDRLVCEINDEHLQRRLLTERELTSRGHTTLPRLTSQQTPIRRPCARPQPSRSTLLGIRSKATLSTNRACTFAVAGVDVQLPTVDSTMPSTTIVEKEDTSYGLARTGPNRQRRPGREDHRCRVASRSRATMCCWEVSQYLLYIQGAEERAASLGSGRNGTKSVMPRLADEVETGLE